MLQPQDVALDGCDVRGEVAVAHLEKELIDELVRLRNGRGLLAPRLAERLGPRLASICGIHPGDTEGEIRRKCIDRFDQLVRLLPDEDALAVRAGLGAIAGFHYDGLTDRTLALAQRLNVSGRTARRRMAHAFNLLAAAMAGQQHDGDDADRDNPDRGWSVLRLESLVRLDTTAPEVTETRTIQARRDGLKVISTRMTLPPLLDGHRESRELEADAQQGARITATERMGTSHFRFVLDLPRPLRDGEEHRYTMIYRVPAERQMRPRYTIVPLVPCEAFELRVRFHPARRPERVWRVDHVPPRVLDDDPQPGEPLDLDDASEVAVDFRSPALGFSYGIAWRPGESDR